MTRTGLPSGRSSARACRDRSPCRSSGTRRSLATLEFLTARKGEAFSIAAQPDQTQRVEQAVEMVDRSESQVFVIEHTRIESLSAQIADGKQFSSFVEPLETALELALPPSSYDLILSVGTVRGLRRGQIDEVREQLRAWIVSLAPTLKLGPDGDDDETRFTDGRALLEHYGGSARNPVQPGPYTIGPSSPATA